MAKAWIGSASSRHLRRLARRSGLRVEPKRETYRGGFDIPAASRAGTAPVPAAASNHGASIHSLLPQNYRGASRQSASVISASSASADKPF